MKTEKHILKGEIKEEDDKKYVIKDEIEEDEALERNGHSEDKALQRGDQKEEAPPAEKPRLPCESRVCVNLPYGVRTDANRALRARSVKERAVLIDAVRRKMLRLNKRLRSTYTPSSGDAFVPLCPRSYQTPMTNDLRNRNVEAISVARDEIQAVMERTQWEMRVVTERLAELETEREQEDLSAWV
ncbi:hypothetical protein N7505_004658 [Penicillium chrysogenum]|uniref:Uncharacterized protein n=1 Tax=Penicillium chrysogenum TaxID=5076 RepID=A0ABQ8WGB8_PENCH|nr:hypothetical protein N7505_004658 [Penicillium chrysogenum]